MTVALASSDLGALRAELDGIDTALLHLMERRLALSGTIAAAKRPWGPELMLRPDREEQVVARLCALSRRIPSDSVAAIWHELMSLNVQAQRRLELAIHAPGHPGGVAARAGARFGVSAPVIVVDSAEQALERARRGVAIAIVELEQRSGWWRALAGDPDLHILDELRATGGRGSALAIGRVAPEHLSSGRQWLVIEEAELAARLCRGEAICPLAAAGGLRLCILEHVPAAVRGAA